MQPDILTEQLYVKIDNERSDRVWHIVPPDPTNVKQLNYATWCGRYVITHRVMTTHNPHRSARMCWQCLKHRRKNKLRQPFI